MLNVRGLQLEYVRFLHETLLVPVIVYVSETMIWNEKEESKIRPVQMDTFRYLLGIKKIDKYPIHG